MKYQQVSVDFVNMVFTAVTYLALAGAAWIFLRLFQACFCLPKHLKKQNDIQQMLQNKVDSYEKYIMECEEKEKAAAEAGESIDDVEKTSENIEGEKPSPVDKKKWKERRECLEMLKRELKRVRDGGDMYDWDHLLEDDEKTEGNEQKDDGDSSNEISEDENKGKSKEALNGKSQLDECEKSENMTEKVEEVKKDK